EDVERFPAWRDDEAEEWHWFVNGPGTRWAGGKFRAQASRAWQLLPPRYYSPAPIHPFRRPPAMCGSHTAGDDWRSWMGFVYHTLEPRGRMVRRLSAPEQQHWPLFSRVGRDLRAPAPIAFLTVDPFEASRLAIELATAAEGL